MREDLSKKEISKTKDELEKELRVLQAQLAVLKESEGERKRAEDEIQLLKSIVLAVSEADDLHSALGIAICKVCEATKWVYGEAWIPSKEDKCLELSPAWYTSEDSLKRFREFSKDYKFKPAVGLSGRTWIAKSPIWIRDASNDQSFHRSGIAKEVGIKSGLSLPIISAGEVIAVMVFFMLEVKDEDKRLVGIVSTVAAQLGAVFQRIQLEEALKEMHKQKELILSSAGEGIYGLDLEGRTTFINPARARMIGWEVKDLIGKPQHDVLHHSKPDGSPYPREECPIYAAFKMVLFIM